jgi:intein/homing endonuclease
MPRGNLTNVRTSGAIETPRSARRSPYVSKVGAGSLMPLTDKERAARQQYRNKTAMYAGDVGTNTVLSGNQSFFSPQLSTDFLELPQSLREKREIYRHFYNTDEMVAQAIDLHTELPLSKVRLAAPKPSTCPKGFDSPDDYGKYILSFFERMTKRIKLFHRLITLVHHYWLDGTVIAFAEDSEVSVPDEVGYDKQVNRKSVLTDDGETREEDEEAWVEKANREDEELRYYQKHYQGWDRLLIFPIDQVKITTFNYTDKVRLELIPSDRDRALIEQASQGDPMAEEMVNEIPAEVREYIASSQLIPLGTDPDEGSFAYLLAGRRGAGDDLGQSILDRCHIAGTPVLVKRDGVIQQVAVEDLDPDTDLVLSHTGAWRDFEVGVRPVREEITLLHVAKIEPPVGCTKDHRYPVLRDGSVVEIQAGDVQVGDYLQVAQVPLSGSLVGAIDLAQFMHGVESDYRARRSGGTSDLRLEVVDQTAHSFTVRYEKEQTDPRKVGRTHDINLILEWASTLSEPVAMRSAEACERFGLHPVTLKEIRAQLVSLGYGVTVTKNKTIIFPPNKAGLKAPTSAAYTKTFPLRSLPLVADFGYFLGFWLGDGHVTKQNGLDYGSLGFTYGPNESASIRAMREQIKPMLDMLKVAWGESPNGAGVHLHGNQDALVRWMAANFGHTSEDKHLPAWVFDANKGFLFGLLRGFCDSDGDVVCKKDGSVSIRFNNTNRVLMDQVFLLCASLGIPVSKTKPTKERWVRQATGEMSWAKPAYTVHFTHGPSVKTFFESGFLAKRQDPDEWKDGRSGSRHIEHDGKLFYRVQSVSTAMHEGPVYSLNVHEDHSFFAGLSRTSNCLRTLYFREKLRQAQTQIASRAMTPKRIVWAEDISQADAEALREQVDLALVDPDYSIITNYEVHWEEMGSRDRLLDLSSEYEQTERRLRTGLGVTETLMSGESLYSADRLKLEVINQRYLFLRELLQEYVEEYLFKPVARRKGFVEKDKWGDEVVLYPRLSFTRLPLRDSQDTYDALFNLYQKGSISIDLILEMFNVDPHDTRIKLERDLFTVNDATFNEVMRGIYGAIGGTIGEQSDVVERVTKYLGLKKKEEAAPAEESRF